MVYLASIHRLPLNRVYLLCDKTRHIGLDAFVAELLPEGKVDEIEKLLDRSGKAKLAFVGDGIHDAPVIARADIGMAMGGLGSDAAIETVDVVLMTDDPSKVAEAINVARKTRQGKVELDYQSTLYVRSLCQHG